MMLKLPVIFCTFFLLYSCSGNHQQDIESLDKVYGKCDNPHREFTKQELKICRAEERSSGEVPDLNLDKLFNKDGGAVTTSLSTTVNTHLWNGSLKTLKKYSLKTADSIGGYIETDWVVDTSNPNNRCSIKVLITSKDLVSNGVSVYFNCQNKVNEVWVNDNNEYIEESKKLVLSILDSASQSFQSSSL